MSEQKTITAVVKNPGEPAKVAQIGNDLETFQAIVGGWIQYLPGSSLDLPPGVDLYSNENAKIVSPPLTPNFWIFDKQDQIWGSCFFVGGDPMTGENRSLTAAECEAVLAWLDDARRQL